MFGLTSSHMRALGGQLAMKNQKDLKRIYKEAARDAPKLPKFKLDALNAIYTEAFPGMPIPDYSGGVDPRSPWIPLIMVISYIIYLVFKQFFSAEPGGAESLADGDGSNVDDESYWPTTVPPQLIRLDRINHTPAGLVQAPEFPKCRMKINPWYGDELHDDKSRETGAARLVSYNEELTELKSKLASQYWDMCEAYLRILWSGGLSYPDDFKLNGGLFVRKNGTPVESGKIKRLVADPTVDTIVICNNATDDQNLRKGVHIGQNVIYVDRSNSGCTSDVYGCFGDPIITKTLMGVESRTYASIIMGDCPITAIGKRTLIRMDGVKRKDLASRFDWHKSILVAAYQLLKVGGAIYYPGFIHVAANSRKNQYEHIKNSILKTPITGFTVSIGAGEIESAVVKLTRV